MIISRKRRRRTYSSSATGCANGRPRHVRCDGALPSCNAGVRPCHRQLNFRPDDMSAHAADLLPPTAQKGAQTAMAGRTDDQPRMLSLSARLPTPTAGKPMDPSIGQVASLLRRLGYSDSHMPDCLALLASWSQQTAQAMRTLVALHDANACLDDRYSRFARFCATSSYYYALHSFKLQGRGADAQGRPADLATCLLFTMSAVRSTHAFQTSQPAVLTSLDVVPRRLSPCRLAKIPRSRRCHL